MHVKRYIKIEKLARRTYHIKDLNIIVKLLYPYRQTINKFSCLLDQMSFTEVQQELLKATVHSLTIINEMYRDKDKFDRIYTTREDVINAIVMLQNELDLKDQPSILSPSVRWFYSQLQQYFGGLDFTSREVSRTFRKSKSTCYRHLTELVDRELVKITGKKEMAYTYHLTETQL